MTKTQRGRHRRSCEGRWAFKWANDARPAVHTAGNGCDGPLGLTGATSKLTRRVKFRMVARWEPRPPKHVALPKHTARFRVLHDTVHLYTIVRPVPRHEYIQIQSTESL